MQAINWKKLPDTINSLSGRERLIITCTTVIILNMIISYIIQPKLIATQAGASANIAAYRSQIEKRSHDIHHIVVEYKNDSDSAVLAKIGVMQKQIDQYGHGLTTIADDFVDPNEMITLIKTLLGSDHIQVRRLENSLPEQLSSNHDTGINIFKHGIYLEIAGSYHNHIHFLKKLEQTPWKIFWKDTQLLSDEKGTSVLSLSIYTLNYDPTWLEL